MFTFFRSCPLVLSSKYFKIVLTFFFLLLSVFFDSNFFIPFFSDFLISDGGSSFLYFIGWAGLLVKAELLGGGPLDDCGVQGWSGDDEDGDELPDEGYDDDGDGLTEEEYDRGVLDGGRVEGEGGVGSDKCGGGHGLLVGVDDVDRSWLIDG